MVETLLISLTVFVLAIFVGYEVITKVPPTLHTPLMSGTNAISGIVLVGALLVAWWLVSAAVGGAYFELVNGFFGSWFGRLVLLG